MLELHKNPYVASMNIAQRTKTMHQTIFYVWLAVELEKFYPEKLLMLRETFIEFHVH